MDIWNRHYTRDESALEIPDENVVRYFSRVKPPGEGKKISVLDLGCGSGRHGIYLLKKGFRVTFQDYAENSLRMVENRLRDGDNRMPGVPGELKDYLVNGSAENLPFAAGCFDYVLAWGILHYNTDPVISSILGEILRVLVSGGKFIGTLRGESDTHLRVSGGEAGCPAISGSYVKLFSAADAQALFSGFSRKNLGYMERRPLGDLTTRICHWIIEAEK